jgi:hypothetical protein
MFTLRFAGASALALLSLTACNSDGSVNWTDVGDIAAATAVVGADAAIIATDPAPQPVIYVDHPEWGWDHPAVVEGPAIADRPVVIHRPAPVVVVKKDERK